MLKTQFRNVVIPDYQTMMVVSTILNRVACAQLWGTGFYYCYATSLALHFRDDMGLFVGGGGGSVTENVYSTVHLSIP